MTEVKFLTFKDKSGAAIKHYQYTATDDASRIRALNIYDRHNQANAISFVDYVIEKFPFRIQMIRTDRGHEFQANSTGMSRTSVSGMATSNPVHPSSMAKSSARIDQTKRNSISC